MSIFSQIKSGQISLGQAVGKIVPFILRLTSTGGDITTPTVPAPVTGAADQIETVEAAIRQHIHAYVVARLGEGSIAALVADRVTDLALHALAGLIEGVLTGAASASK